jgi:hypothetical protein
MGDFIEGEFVCPAHALAYVLEHPTGLDAGFRQGGSMKLFTLKGKNKTKAQVVSKTPEKTTADTYEGKTITITVIGNKSYGISVDGQEAGYAVGDLVVNVNGPVDTVETLSGNVNVAGDVKNIETTSGSVECDDVSGDIQTVSGSVACAKVSGDIDTVSGSVIVR